MKKDQIAELFLRFEQVRYETDGVEYWSARELSELFQYKEWRNFSKVVDKAKQACVAAGEAVADHFVGVNKMVDLGSDAQREIQDVALTRYACYLVAQNGDPGKSEVAFAQTYFAIQTRKQELVEQRLLELARVAARDKLSKAEKKLSGIIYERGVDELGFGKIRSKGDQILFGGFSTKAMKERLQIPDNRPLADFLPTLTIKAKDFATELTSHNVVEKDLQGEQKISQEHVENNKAVRKMLEERGVKPEALPAAEDIQVVQRRLLAEEKKAVKASKKLQKKPTKKK